MKFDGFLTLYQEGRDEDPEDEEARRLPQMSGRRAAGEALDRRRPAFHRTAAALFRSLAGQAHGRARHRPALDLRLDPASAQGPQICAARQAPAHSGGSRPYRRRLPGKLLRQIRRIRFHRRPRRAARSDFQQRSGVARRAARFLARLHRRHRRDQGFEDLRRHRRARCAVGAASVSAARGRQRSARLPDLQQWPAVAEALEVRRLHRLHELSGMPLYAAAVVAGRRLAAISAPRSSAWIRSPASTSPCAAAASVPICRSARPSKDGEKPKRAGLPKGVAPDEIDLERALALLSLPREVGTQPRGRRADPSPASAASGPTSSTARPTPISIPRKRSSPSGSIAR